MGLIKILQARRAAAISRYTRAVVAFNENVDRNGPRCGLNMEMSELSGEGERGCYFGLGVIGTS